MRFPSRGQRRLAPCLAAVVCLAAIGGCGYSLRAPFDPTIRTVYVPVFRSMSFRRDMNLQLTELVQKEIERRTPFKVVGSPEGADTILDGTVNFADKNLVVENPFNLPRQLTAMINVTGTWTHNPPSKEELDRPPSTAPTRRSPSRLSI